jgi:conjugal transfer pilus assembly protein TraU
MILGRNPTVNWKGRLSFAILLVIILIFAETNEALACPGRIFNPITDVDWMGIFPIKIGGVTVAGFGQEDTDTVDVSPICFCEDRPSPLNVVPGIPVSFWEPVRILGGWRYYNMA